MKKIYIKKSVVKNIEAGHPWCFSGAIEKNEEGINDGECCEIYSENKFLGIGYYNSKTDIQIRILTRFKQEINKTFFLNRFKNLKIEKEKFITNTDAYRLVFGDSDHIPGLVIDIYKDIIVIQVHTMGIEKLKDFIIQALITLFNPKMIFEKSDIGIRIKEGLKRTNESVLYGDSIPAVDIIENNIKFRVNIFKGQKTGFFLDQRENRNSIVKYCENKKVLNCFCYTGGFSVYASKNAASITSIDISKTAIEYVKINFDLNGINADSHKFIAMDVFEYLKDMKNNEYDVIIIDPPSFAKSRKQIKNAIKAYITINSLSLEKLPDYGILISSSCTSHIDEPTFIKILHQSSINAECELKVLESKLQPIDHTYNLSFPEGRYLKFFILQKQPFV